MALARRARPLINHQCAWDFTTYWRTPATSPASAGTESRSPTRHSGGRGRAATRSCGTPGSSPASAVTAPCGWSRPMGKRPSRAQARAERFGWSAWRAPYEARKEGISPEAEGRAAKQALAGCVLMARPSPTGLATSTSRSSHGEWSRTAHQPQQEKSTMNGKINTPRTVCKAIVAVAIAAIAGIRPRRRRRVGRTK